MRRTSVSCVGRGSSLLCTSAGTAHLRDKLLSHGVLRQVCLHPQGELLELLPLPNHCANNLSLLDLGLWNIEGEKLSSLGGEEQWRL